MEKQTGGFFSHLAESGGEESKSSVEMLNKSTSVSLLSSSVDLFIKLFYRAKAS